MYTTDRDKFRQAFYTAWEKHKQQLPLEAVEAQLVQVILEHPEYHALLNNQQMYQEQEFALEENPFFHLSLHLAVRDQVRLNSPRGITAIYQRLLTQYPSALDVEHHMMQCLAQVMWRGDTADEQVYLQMLSRHCEEGEA